MIAWLTALTVGWGAPAAQSPAALPQPDRPNVVYILADDLGCGDVSCYNSQSRISMPHLDRLASQGILFTDAHSGSSVCTPTRYGILTGRYAWRTRLTKGVLGGASPHLIEPGRLTVAGLLQSNGYHTACIGKWHLGMDWPTRGSAPFGDTDKPAASLKLIDYTQPIRHGPTTVGFNQFFGIAASLDMPPFIYIENDRTLGQATATRKWLREGPAAPDFEAVNVLKDLTGKAAGYIRGRATIGQPFFLYLALTSPHTPVVPRPEFQGKTPIGDYGDFVVETDWAVGEIMNALGRAGLERNTILIFTSDNGATPQGPAGTVLQTGHRPNGPWRGAKSDIWEGGHRVPFIVRWPGRAPAGTTCDDPICLTSLMATCAELLGVTLPADAGEDSFSILPWLRGRKPARPTHDAVVHHSINGLFAVRRGPWKFADGQGSGGWSKGGTGPHPGQLYDLSKDPAERENLYAQRSDLVKELKALLERYRTEGRSRSTP